MKVLGCRTERDPRAVLLEFNPEKRMEDVTRWHLLGWCESMQDPSEGNFAHGFYWRM